MKKKIAILGGAFDPITKGHVHTAQLVLESGLVEEVWIVPCFHSRYDKKMASPEHRLVMCRLACAGNPRIKVSDYEIENKLHGETYLLLLKFLEGPIAKEYDFSFIIGMDNANEFSKWYEYRKLEKLIRFVVVPRTGVERDEKIDWYLESPHVLLETKQLQEEMSSTLARALFRKGDDVSPYLDEKVLNYIKDYGLYQ